MTDISLLLSYVPGASYGFSGTSLLIFFGTMALGLWASWRVRSNFNRYSQFATASGATGAQVAQAILRHNGIHDVEVVPVPGSLTDHYDPTHKRLALSETVYGSRSIAAIGVAAHECGHALQHQASYAPLHARMALVSVQGIATNMVMWLPLLGMFTGIFSSKMGIMLMAIGWGAIMVFNLVTLPVEFDASRRAKVVLADMGFIRGDEGAGVSKVLGAAAWTYVAAFITSLAYFLYYLLPLLGGRRDE